MRGLFQRRLCVVLASAAAGFAVWKSLPVEDWDRLTFTTVASGFINPPLFISGDGSAAAPWQLRAFTFDPKTDKHEAPVIVSLDDDVEGFFQESPPSPIDVAVIFTNFQRLGAKKAATSAVFAWDEPDPIALVAFEKSLDRFDSLVMAAPLTRGPVDSPIPPALRRASVPASSVIGNLTALPIVNRVSIPNIILGGEKTLAGFSVLDTESIPTYDLLFARWEDRVVISFPLLTVLQRLNLPPEGLEIHLGEYMKLSPAGPVVPIDEFGRLDLPVKLLSAYAEIPAEKLIDGGDDLFPKQAPNPVILRDDRTTAGASTRGFSKGIAGIIAAIASDDALTPTATYRRLPREWEWGILGVAVLLLAACCGKSPFIRSMVGLAIAGTAIAAMWAGFGIASVWLPAYPVVAAVLTALIVAPVFRLKPPPIVLPEIFLPSEAIPEPEPETTPEVMDELPGAPAPESPPPTPPHRPLGKRRRNRR